MKIKKKVPKNNIILMMKVSLVLKFFLYFFYNFQFVELPGEYNNTDILR